MPKSAQFVKVILMDELGHIETPWAVPLGRNRYRLDNIPALARGVSWQDVIEARPRAKGELPEFVRIVEKSGYKTLRLVLEPPANKSPSSRKVVERLVEMGCRHEGAGNRRAFVVSIPPALDVGSVQEFLDSKGQKWEMADPPDEAALG